MGFLSGKEKEKTSGNMDMMVASLIYVVLGLILTINPMGFKSLVCFIIAGILVIMGVIRIVRFLIAKNQSSVYQNDLVVGIILLILGAVFGALINVLVSVIIMILGISVSISGLTKLQSSLEIKRMGENNWVTFLVIAIINIALGLWLTFSPLKATGAMLRLVGLCILISGLTDFISKVYVTKKMKEYQADMRALEQDGKWK